MRVNKSKIQLLFVGHETYGWERGTFQELRENYQDCLEKGLNPEEPKRDFEGNWNVWDTYKSPFWHTARKISKRFPCSKSECFAWSNLNRMDKEANGTYRPKSKIAKEMIEKFPLLPEEIKICNPKIIVFLTNDKNLLKTTYKKIDQKISSKTIKKFNGHNLLEIRIPGFNGKAYMLPHPSYIVRMKNSKLIDKIIDKIAEDYKNS